MKKIIFLALWAVLLSVTAAFGWGDDIQVFSGTDIQAFDVEWATDGTMFVAVQAAGEDVKVLRSQDHGLTWDQIRTLPTYVTVWGTIARDLQRIRLIYDELNDQLLAFMVFSNGDLYRYRCPIGSSGDYLCKVSAWPILEGSFDVSQNLNDGRIFGTWMEGVNVGDRTYTGYSDNAGGTWTDIFPGAWGWGAETRQSITYGPPDNVFWAYSTQVTTSGSKEVVVGSSTDNGASVSAYKLITNNAYKDYDPRVCAANVDDSGLWVLYNRDIGGDVGLHYRYSPDAGQNWNASEYTVSALSGVDEYIADVKFYKLGPNQYVNMVYIKDDPSADPVRQAVWAYSSTGHPEEWRDSEVFNDADVQPWPEDVAPRLVYSPGAAVGGSGAVFSHYGREGLYFDAPWIEPASYTLTVTVNGSANVSSSPAGIDCTSSGMTLTQTCTFDFNVGENVALTATPIDGAGFTSHFLQWSGDFSGTNPACAILMDSDKTVTADFGALGIPAYALPLPDAQDAYSYLPVEDPVDQYDVSLCKPFAVGDVAGGTLSLHVLLHQFGGNIDVYLGFYSTALDPNQIFLITAGDGCQTLDDGIDPWMANTPGNIDETIWGDIPISLLPSGTYHLYVLVAPAGADPLNLFYLWSTYFLVP